MPNRNIPANSVCYIFSRSVRTDFPPPPYTIRRVQQNWDSRNLFAGIENPAWKNQILLRMDASTPYTAASLREKRRDFGSAKTHTPYPPEYGFQVYDETIGDPTNEWISPPLTDDLGTCDNMARVKFFNDVQADFSAGTFLGELRETIRMVRKPALSLRKGVERFRYNAHVARNKIVLSARRKQLSQAAARKEYVKAVSDSWLEYRFGWTPLIMDIEGAYQTLCARLTEPDSTRRFTARVKTISKIPDQLMTVSQPTSTINCEVRRTVVNETWVTYKGMIYNQITSDMPLLESLGALPEQFIPTAWELLPYSFVVDYFSNVGDVLNAYATALRLRYVYVCATRRVKTTSIIRGDFKVSPGSNAVMLDSKPGLCYAVAKSVSRTPLSGVPLPYFELTNKLSTSRGLNLGALLASRAEDVRFRNRLRL